MVRSRDRGTAMDNIELGNLRIAATKVAGELVCSAECAAGTVAAALLTSSGRVFTGICIDARCSLGFCAEHAAVAEMLKHRQTRILALVAVRAGGEILPPCGRCRELIRQVDPGNWATEILVAEGRIETLNSLMPFAAPALPASPSGSL